MEIANWQFRKGEYMTTQRINEKLGAWLLIEGNTRDELAKELGMTRPTLANRLNGTTKWEWDEVLKISRLVGCSLDWLAEIGE